MKKLVYIFFSIATISVVSLLSSCNAEKSCIRAKEKALRGGCLKIDTLRFSDTIRGFTHDTIVQFDSVTLTDTITIEKNGIKTVTVVKWKDRVVEQTITQHDTIRHYMKPIVKEVCPPLSWWDINKFWIGVILGVVFMAFGGVVLNKLISKL